MLLIILGGLTLNRASLASRLHIGRPPDDSTQNPDIAHAATGPAACTVFQVLSALLLAAASSTFGVGPGLLKTLAGVDQRPGVFPSWLGRAKCQFTTSWRGLVSFLAAAGREQKLGSRVGIHRR